MSNLNDEYEKIINKIESSITDEKELQLIKSEIAKLTILFINTVDKVMEYSEEKLSNMEEKHEDLEERLNTLQNKMSKMEKDIYEEDEDGFEFEVVCPYCNYQFVTDIDLELNSEIKCPECKNIIELDWNDDNSEEESCNGNCKKCEECNKNEEDFTNLQELKKIEIDLEDKDDDM